MIAVNSGWLLSQYVILAQSIASMFSPLVEVVVHDFRPKKPGILAIYGGSITGRRIGDPTTNLGKKRISGRNVPDVLVGYHTKSSSGRPLKSTSIAIRLPDATLIGSFCINFDLTLMNEMAKLLTTLGQENGKNPLKSSERFRSSLHGDEVASAIQDLIREQGSTLQQLSSKHRQEIVAELQSRGLFNRRGAVSTTARVLGVTRPTVYRWRNFVRNWTAK